MDTLEMIDKVVERLNKKYTRGDELFKIVSRLAEECGEVAQQVNHYEIRGVNTERNNRDNKDELISEIYQVMLVSYQLIKYFGLEDGLKEKIVSSYQDYKTKGFEQEPFNYKK